MIVRGRNTMPGTTTSNRFAAEERVYLEKLRLAAEIILRMAEDPNGISDVLESELYLFLAPRPFPPRERETRLIVPYFPD
jgi:hypothetical protein